MRAGTSLFGRRKIRKFFSLAAALSFTDLLGERFYFIKVERDVYIDAGAKKRFAAKYRAGGDSFRLRDMPHSDVKVMLEVKKIALVFVRSKAAFRGDLSGGGRRKLGFEAWRVGGRGQF